MSGVNVYVSDSSDDDELDQLLQKAQLEEPDSEDGNNNDSGMIPSQVPLFAAVGSPTDQPLSETSLALVDEGSNGVQCPEGGPCQ